jgi:hypothetical protein
MADLRASIPREPHELDAYTDQLPWDNPQRVLEDLVRIHEPSQLITLQFCLEGLVESLKGNNDYEDKEMFDEGEY